TAHARLSWRTGTGRAPTTSGSRASAAVARTADRQRAQCARCVFTSWRLASGSTPSTTSAIVSSSRHAAVGAASALSLAASVAATSRSSVTSPWQRSHVATWRATRPSLPSPSAKATSGSGAGQVMDTRRRSVARINPLIRTGADKLLAGGSQVTRSNAGTLESLAQCGERPVDAIVYGLRAGQPHGARHVRRGHSFHHVKLHGEPVVHGQGSHRLGQDCLTLGGDGRIQAGPGVRLEATERFGNALVTCGERCREGCLTSDGAVDVAQRRQKGAEGERREGVRPQQLVRLDVAALLQEHALVDVALQRRHSPG